MPQHPQYCETPEESVEELCNLMDLVVKYGLGHEDVIYPIVEEGLNAIYQKEAARHASDMGEEFDENGNPLFSASSSALFEYVDLDAREQYVADLRNAISVAMSGDFSDPAGAVLALR
jgi:hypothetical protein